MSEQAPRTHDLVIRRIVEAPLGLAWRLWTEPEHVRRWWGPALYTCPSAELDLRVGGRYLWAMQAPAEHGGAIHYTADSYQRIEHERLLEFTAHLADATGAPLPATDLPPGFPAELVHTVEFRALGELTELTITERHWPEGPMLVMSYAGMHQSLDKWSGLRDGA